MSFLTIWDAAQLDGLDSLADVLARASDDDRVRHPCYLLVRSDTTAARTVCVRSALGGETMIHVQPAARAPSVKHPLGHAPVDTIIGPVTGSVSYLPSPRGLWVLAFENPGKDHDHAG